MATDVPAQGVSLPASQLYRPVIPAEGPEAYRSFWQLWGEHKFFECHEVLEELWRETTGEVRWFYNGLIHCAVALHQHWAGNAEGAARQLVRAGVKLNRFAPEYSGVDVGALLKSVECEIQASLNSLTLRQQARLPELRHTLTERIERELSSKTEE